MVPRTTNFITHSGYLPFELFYLVVETGSASHEVVFLGFNNLNGIFTINVKEEV